MRGFIYLSFLGSLSLGITLGWNFHAGILIFLLLFISTVVLFFPQKKSFVYVIPLLFILLGMLLVCLSKASIERGVVSNLARNHAHAEIVGKCMETPSRRNNFNRFFLSVGTVSYRGKTWKTSEKVYVTTNAVRKDVIPGKYYVIEGLLGKSRSGRWLDEHGASAYLSAEKISIARIKADSTSSMIYRAREGLSRSFEKVFGKRIAGFMSGVALGKLNSTDEDIVSNLRVCGLSHIVAVSGLHVGAVSGLIVSLGALLGIGRRNRYIFAGATALLVLVLANFRPSATRAALMGGLCFLGVIIGREYDSLIGLSIAGFAILSLNPLALFDAGFQYSFAAAAGIIISLKVSGNRGGSKNAIFALAGAQLGILPILLMRGEPIPVISIISNLFVVPTIGPILLGGFITALFSLIWMPLASAISVIPSLLSRFVITLSSALSKVPMAFTNRYAGIASAILYSIGLVLLIRHLRHSSRRNILPHILIAFGLSITLVLIPLFPVGFTGKTGRMIVFDIGQGDSSFLQDKCGRTVLVDGGPDGKKIVRKLREYGVSRIDLMVLSHPHADHITGLLSVMEEFPVGKILDPGTIVSDGLYHDFLKAADRKSIPRVLAFEGDDLKVSESTSIEVLYAPQSLDNVPDELNDQSMVMIAYIDGVRVLLTGDIEGEGQEILLGYHPELSCDVLKVPHQGASDSVTPELLDASKPRVCTISVEKGNSYGHPSLAGIHLMESKGAKVLRTDTCGDIELSLSNGRISIKTKGRR
ncbi:MAG: DNA internalization-related competence protein ComEC/Rec2 [Actinomycetota bacterium]|nr:DNA internalization-related competence protein ComEC/Rec2 [Actinomycetota bacterium]